MSNGKEAGKLRSVLGAQNSPVWLKHQHSGLGWWAEAEMHRALGREGDLPWEALPWAGLERASARGTGRKKQMLAQPGELGGRRQWEGWREGVEKEEGGSKGYWDFNLQEDRKNGWNQLFQTLQGLAMCSTIHSNT